MSSVSGSPAAFESSIFIGASRSLCEVDANVVKRHRRDAVDSGKSPSAAGNDFHLPVGGRKSHLPDDLSRRFEQEIAREGDAAPDDHALRRENVDKVRQAETEVVSGACEDPMRSFVSFARRRANLTAGVSGSSCAREQTLRVAFDRLGGKRKHALFGGIGFEATGVAAAITHAWAVRLDDDVADATGPTRATR